jgi:2-methylcitrate dehydratase PrpD
VHSGVVIVPALLAAAQKYKLGNDRVMLGIAAGTELLCRLALTLPKAVHKAGFHPTAVLGTFAATFGIAVARGADEKTIVNALGIAGSTASGIIEYLGDGSWTKRMHPGWSAQSALRSFAMAEAGFFGPRMVFEGTHGAFKTFAPSIEPKTDKLFEGLGETFVMDTITFKPYPCGTMVQPYIDAATGSRSN